jgi:hypothetical protein
LLLANVPTQQFSVTAWSSQCLDLQCHFGPSWLAQLLARIISICLLVNLHHVFFR